MTSSKRERGRVYRYVVTVTQDCSIRPQQVVRVVEINHLRPSDAIAKALAQVEDEIDYSFWQSDEVTVKCERTP